MTLETIIGSMIQSVGILLSVVVALLGYTIAKRNELDLTKRRERLDLIDKQLNDFYGPLYVLTEVGRMSYQTLRNKLSDEHAFDREPMDESDLREWRLWVEYIFVPLNQLQEDLIIRNAHLIREATFPELLLQFITHASLYKTMVEKWKRGDYQEYLPVIDYPIELGNYAAQSYQTLKEEQLALIGAMKPTQNRQQ
jgi:hypothetical protein